jgi:hypothetical protein
MQPQQSVDFARLFGCCPATRSATPAATRDATATSAGRSSAGLGEHPGAAPALAWPGRRQTPSRGQSYAPTVNDLSAGIDTAEPRVTWLTKVLKPGECEVIEISAIAPHADPFPVPYPRSPTRHAGGSALGGLAEHSPGRARRAPGAGRPAGGPKSCRRSAKRLYGLRWRPGRAFAERRGSSAPAMRPWRGSPRRCARVNHFRFDPLKRWIKLWETLTPHGETLVVLNSFVTA